MTTRKAMQRIVDRERPTEAVRRRKMPADPQAQQKS
jgi:hypothetical protein